MKQPSKLLDPGTRVITHDRLGSVVGILVDGKHIAARRPSTPGTIHGYVPRYVGEVYWVSHEGVESKAAYSFAEFELDQESP
jgi:hypothetical protein